MKTSTISSSKDMSSSYDDSIWISKRSCSMSWNESPLGDANSQGSKEGRRKETLIVGRQQDFMFSEKGTVNNWLRKNGYCDRSIARSARKIRSTASHGSPFVRALCDMPGNPSPKAIYA
eukprot:CAMPEP_0184368428 /NCGR_PEP_ID=MMETSP1089-20130417/161654_1 /TAXON_ID=38269 ORGANISM="Gloeochaete wittrockiana, Strain SAG46.84" /NCGR_SAMPLE_ID=MMETSP1089 /ASSEMBLY_ACC=CAM_ASM_000445 /LENGTH=118 /DNA_ID=CAMNT_0026710705 /DNA_START=834 /DNA_END=1187 /DNA_ORIENTATION=+